MTLLPSSDRAFQSQVATRDGAQNTLVWIDARLYGLHLTATQLGGSARGYQDLREELAAR
jgi:hypothetical protein